MTTTDAATMASLTRTTDQIMASTDLALAGYLPPQKKRHGMRIALSLLGASTIASMALLLPTPHTAEAATTTVCHGIHTTHSAEKLNEGRVAYGQQHRGPGKVLDRPGYIRYLGMVQRDCGNGSTLVAVPSQIGAGWHLYSITSADSAAAKQAYRVCFTDGNAADRRATFRGLVTGRQAEGNGWSYAGRAYGVATPQAGLVYAWA